MDKSGYSLVLGMIENWRDISLSADMRIVDVEPAAECPGGGIALRSESIGSFGSYYIHGSVCGWYAACDAKAEVNNQVWMIELRDEAQIGDWYRLKIEVLGNNISYYLDDELQHESKDNLHPSGGVCLFVSDAIVEFDNVVIEGPDIPDAGPSGYAVQPKAKLATTWSQIKKRPEAYAVVI